MTAPFVCLVLAICAVWLPAPGRGWSARCPPWAVLYGLAVGWAAVQGVVTPPAVAALALLVALALWARRGSWAAWACLLVLCAALALHRVPGFHNPVAIDALRFSADGRAVVQYLNFDKGSVGLVLLALLAPRLRRGDALGRIAASTALVWCATTCAVLGLALAVGTVHPDPKLPPQAALFLAVNLFLTCAAEQVMFRLLVQDPLRRLPLGRHASAAAIAVSAALFGLAHAAGGAWMVLLAGLAGVGHAIAYERTRRIEAPILVHFGLNAAHVLLFTYPALASP